MTVDASKSIDFLLDKGGPVTRYRLRWPTPYAEIALETDHRSDTALWCELTFWAVQLFHFAGMLNVV